MTVKEVVINFERRLQTMYPDMVLENKPTSDLILQYLNDSINKFVTTRFTGNNYKQLSFEQDQKRIDDLRTLVRTNEYSFSELQQANGDYEVSLPSDYLHLVGESVGIWSCDSCWGTDDNGDPIVRDTDVLEATIENIDRQRDNTLSEYRLHANRARPLRLIRGNSVYLYTDGNYYIDSYTMTYIKSPEMLTLDDPTAECELSDYVMKEIIKLAINTYLADRGDNRFNAAATEVSTME